MNSELTFKKLIDYFQARVTRIENDERQFISGDMPQHPLLVMFLGEDTQSSFVQVASYLYDLWPQCIGHIPFLSANRCDEVVSLQQLSLSDDGQVMACDLSMDQLASVYDELRAEDVLFNNMSIRHLYYMIDASSIDAVDTFDEQVNLIPYIKELMGVREYEIRDTLIVLLPGESKKRAVTNRIRTQMSSFYGPERCIDCDSILLLSNERNDGVLLRSWQTCYRISALYMALSNCANDVLNKGIFQHRILTASYSIVSKPTRSIAQVVLDEYLRELKDRQQPVDYDLLQTEGISKRLGISQEGTFVVIDRDAERVIQKIVPSEEELNLFPRSSCNEYDITQKTFKQFDEFCMGSLSTYLDIRQNKLLGIDESQRKRWTDAYGAMLRTNFTNDELVYLGNNIADVRAYLENRKVRINAGGVIEGATHMLKASLSTDRNILSAFIKQIQLEANRVETFRKIWEELLMSLVAVKKVNDHAIIDFYQHKAKYYLDDRGAAEFYKLTDVEAMEKYLCDAIDSIINSDRVFYAPFEAEIMQRLQATEEDADAYGWILKQLTGGKLHMYLRVSFALGDPIAKTVFIEGDSELKRRLCAALEKDVQFYNTGSNRCVEVLNVFVVEESNLR